MLLTEKHKNYLIVAVFIPLSLWGLFCAVSFGKASLDFYAVKNILALWQEQGQQPTSEQYQLAKKKILSAVNYHPNHPTYVDLLAQIYERGAIAEFEGRSEALLLSKQYYLQATRLRPLWPVTWASLVMIKWRLQEFDQEMLDFLQHANTLGPKKLEVHVLYTKLGLALYRSNSPLFLQLKDDIAHRIALGLQNSQSRSDVNAIIEEYKAQKVTCRWLRNQDPNIKRIIRNCK